MASEEEFWDAQLARLLAGYAEPQVRLERLQEIGKRLAAQLSAGRPEDADIRALLRHYREPEMDPDRLAKMGEELAAQLAPQSPTVSRPARRRLWRRAGGAKPRAGVWAAAAALAACALVAFAFFLARPSPSAKAPEEGMSRQPEPDPAPPSPVAPRPRPDVQPPRQEEPPQSPPVEAPRPPKIEPPPPPPEGPRPAPPRPTQVAPAVVAVLERIDGAVHVVSESSERAAAQAGQELTAGQGIETGRGAQAAVVYRDSSRLEIGAETTLRQLSLAGGKSAVLAAGTITATVAKQATGEPMVIRTPHAEAQVLGTRLALAVGEATRLEVREGRVRLTRLSDRKSVDVATGYCAVAAPGIDLVAIRETVLFRDDFDQGRLAPEAYYLSVYSGQGVRAYDPRQPGKISISAAQKAVVFKLAANDSPEWIGGGIALRRSFPLKRSVSLQIRARKSAAEDDLNYAIHAGPPDVTAAGEQPHVKVQCRGRVVRVLAGAEPGPFRTLWSEDYGDRVTGFLTIKVVIDKSRAELWIEGSRAYAGPHGLRLGDTVSFGFAAGNKRDAVEREVCLDDLVATQTSE